MKSGAEEAVSCLSELQFYLDLKKEINKCIQTVGETAGEREREK